ncbi:hypothetical protein Pcinc_001039 [Petrolisthes cinctipes]|uniref:PHD-type domain-containing protein n=1 Tax=Petrolisthes cinctipes TaxID=88211 RepID=A0AAE1L492_PETCI|nr:hypothetical protein Pcinc_001038 [Petrolisthes cinctipes]KAK3895179.1 hypothetical protein Pcinc_001039 [Petrolisthes cinctipes]
MGSPVDELCLVCHERDDGKVKWLKCLKCKLGGHSTCTRMTGLKSNASEVNWVCDLCALVIKSEVHLREEINVMKSDIIEIKNMLKDIRLPENLQNSVMAALTALTDRVTLAVEEAVSAQSGQVEKDGMNWAEVVSRSRKRKRTQKNKNLLIIKAKGSEKAVDMKKEVEELLSDVQIMDSKFTNKGNIVINLESEEKRNAAQNKLHEVGNLIVSNGKRWDPKIMVCNVARNEDKESLIEEIIVYDRYFPLLCYHCLKFGHKSDSCQSKVKGHAPHCYKCAGQHEGRSCQSDVRKCFNCAASKRQSEHSVSSLSRPIFTSEVNRIRLNTNHGF